MLNCIFLSYLMKKLPILFSLFSFIFLAIISLALFTESGQRFTLTTVKADAYSDACIDACIGATGDPGGAMADCAYLCGEGNTTYGCLLASQIGWFDVAYSTNSENWCAYVQTSQQLCNDRCQILNTSYQYYGDKCANTCADAAGDSLACVDLAENTYFDSSVDSSFCSMLDVLPPELPDPEVVFSIDVWDGYYHEVIAGNYMTVQGIVNSPFPVDYVEIYEDGGDGHTLECTFEEWDLPTQFHFSCNTQTYEFGGETHYYYIYAEDTNYDYIESSAVEIYIVGEAEPDLNAPQIEWGHNPNKTVNTTNYVVKGNVYDYESSLVDEINIFSNYDTSGDPWVPQTTTSCTCDDGACNSGDENFTCIIPALDTIGENYYCVEAFDEFDNRKEECIGVYRYEEVEDDLLSYWPLEVADFNLDSIGYSPYGDISSSEYIVDIEGFSNRGRRFDAGGYITVDDYNRHFSFSDSNSQFLAEAYVKDTDFTGGWQRVLGKMNDDLTENSWLMGIDEGGGLYCAFWTSNDLGSQRSLATRDDEIYLTPDEWNHIACSWDATTRELKGYINHSLVKTVQFEEGAEVVESSSPLVIGGQTNGAQAFNGEIDEVKIYNVPNFPVVPDFTNLNIPGVTSSSSFNITGTANYGGGNILGVQSRPYIFDQDEGSNWDECSCIDGSCNSNEEEFSCNVTGLTEERTYTYELRYSFGDPVEYLTSDKWIKADILRNDEDNLVAWWTFDGLENLIDRSVSGLDGSKVGTITSGESLDTGSFTNIFPRDGYYLVPDPNGILDFSGTTDEFTVDVLVKPSTDLQNDQRYLLFAKSNETGDDLLWEMGIIGGSNVLYTTIKTVDGNIGFDTQNALTLGVWNRIRLSFSNLDQTYTVKINNNNVESRSFHKAFNMPSSTGNMFIGAFIHGESQMLGEIDDIRITTGADAKAPVIVVSELEDPERVTNPNQEFHISVTDETGIEDFEYLFFDYEMGNDLDNEAWVQIDNPLSGSWGDNSLTFDITAPDLSDGPWYLFTRSTDSNGFKHYYTNDGWYTHVDSTTPSAMPYYRFVVEADDTTPPFIFAQSIVPNPTVDKNPGVRGYVKDYMTEGVGDTPSNIASIEYRLTKDEVVGEWVNIPALNVIDSSFEEFYFQLENLLPGNYDLEIRASDTTGNSTEDNGSNHEESFIIYEPDVLPEVSVLEKEEDFNDHQYHDVLFSDGVWGNGILRLRQQIDFSQETEFYTNSNDFAYKFGNAIVGDFPSVDGNLWIITNDSALIYYNINNGSYVKYTNLGGVGRLVNLKEMEYQSERYLVLAYENEGTVIYDINNTPMNIGDDPSPVNYRNKADFDSYRNFVPFSFDTRNGKFAYYSPLGVTVEGDAKFFIWVDTKGTIMDIDDDTYVTWGRSDNLFYINQLWGYHYEGDFTASYLDQSNNVLVTVSYNFGVYQCTDGGTPEDKSDDSCRRQSYPNNAYGVFSIIEDPNGYYWLGGNDGLSRINQMGTPEYQDDVWTRVLTNVEVGYGDISQLVWVPGEYPVGDEVWMLTRSGYLRALEFNYTYTDSLDDTGYTYRIRNIDARAGGMSTLVMTDRNTIYTVLQGYGLQKISLARSFEDTNVIEMLPIPPDGILAINYIDLEEVLGSVTSGSLHSFNELVSYEVSNDSGVTWYPITLSQRVEFPTPDYKLKLRINLNKGSSPIIDLIRLSYVTYPDTDPDQCDIKINDEAPVITSLQPTGTNSMKVKFTGISDEPSIEKYVLEYGLSSTVFQFTPINLAPGATSYTVSGLALNTNYYFRIRAITDCTNSNWSNVLSAKHTGQPVQPPVVPPVEEEKVVCGEVCNIDDDCGDDNNVCISGRCQMDVNFCEIEEKLDDDKCACISETSTGGLCGDVCNVDLDCTIEGNSCVGGRCKQTSCPVGSKLNESSCGCVGITVPSGSQDDNETVKSIGGIFAAISEFFDSIPVSVGTAEVATSITMITVVTASLASVAFGSSYPLSFILQGVAYAMGVMKLRKKSRDYGLVYDSVTKEPLNRVIVRIFDVNDKLVATEVTDVYGVFETHLKDSGQYKILVMAKNYDYPSKVVVGDVDGLYEHVYRGGLFNYDSNLPINFSIPVDPYEQSMPEYSKAVFMSRISTVFSNLQNILVVLGLGFSIVTYAKNPSMFNLLLLIAYFVFVVINIVIYLQGRHKYGVVRDMSFLPKPGVALGLRELEFEKVLSQRVTDSNGKYRFIVPNGKYRVEVLNPSLEVIPDSDLTVEKKSKGVIVVNRDIRVRNRSV